jgi:hypothetical protein
LLRASSRFFSSGLVRSFAASVSSFACFSSIFGFGPLSPPALALPLSFCFGSGFSLPF